MDYFGVFSFFVPLPFFFFFFFLLKSPSVDESFEKKDTGQQEEIKHSFWSWGGDDDKTNCHSYKREKNAKSDKNIKTVDY